MRGFFGIVQDMLARTRARGLLIVIGMVLCAVSIWTASPLAWLWIASQMDSGSSPTMGAIGVVIAGVCGTTIAIGKVLAILNARYRDLHGQRATIKLHLSWLRSLRGERPHERGDEVELTVLDVILVSSIFIAVGIFELWYLFKSGSSLDGRSGRL
jgi:divalent metal cation (Fe/Co/Zn/Cd) transporter